MGTAQQPLVYEIHTAAFLHRLSKKHGRTVQLNTVPEQEWDRLTDLGVTMVWLMGAWQRSPAGTRLSMIDRDFFPELQKDIPDLRTRDVIGSAYCVRNYEVDEQFGGKPGLAEARKQLAQRGIGLMLDFVPNHTAPDHSWITEHPDYFITGSVDDFKNDPASFLHIGDTVFARGRDPHYAAWPDVVQLNAFSEGYRQAAIDTLRSIANQSDAVRCDMAMLMFRDIFAKTWRERAGIAPEQDFWTYVITEVRKTHPDFIFLAESYWNTETELVEQGFSYCYDKSLYDLLLDSSPRGIHHYAEKLGDSQEQLCRFIENHDEPRAAALYASDKQKAAATVILTLPGMHLLHDGQMEGWGTKIPVHVNQGPAEETDLELQSFYQRLLTALKPLHDHKLKWYVWQTDNESVLGWEWRDDAKRFITLVNYSGQPTNFELHIDAAETFVDAMTDRPVQPKQATMITLEFKPWGCKLLSSL